MTTFFFFSFFFSYSLWHWSSQWKDTLELVQAVHFLSINSQAGSIKAVTWQDFYFNIFTLDKIILEERQWSNIYRQCSLAQSIVKLNTQNYVGIMLMLWYEDKRQYAWNEGWLFLINPPLRWGQALLKQRTEEQFPFHILWPFSAFQWLVCYLNILCAYLRSLIFKYAFVCVCVSCISPRRTAWLLTEGKHSSALTWTQGPCPCPGSPCRVLAAGPALRPPATTF